MILDHFSRSLRETFPARASEWALGLMLFLWSVILIANPDVFTGPSYRGLVMVAEQDTWAMLCLLVGGGRLLVLAVNGAWRRSPHMRSAMAFFSCFFWYQITIGMMQSGTWATGLAVYPVLLGLDAFNAIRTLGEAGASDNLHKRAANDGADT